LALLPSLIDEVFLYGALLKIFPAVANVWLSPAEAAGAAPAGLAEADVCRFVDCGW
jgi:hypothetical protein